MASNANKILDWTHRFERFERANSTVAQFCHDERVSVQAFYYWRERVKRDRQASSLATGSSNGRGRKPQLVTAPVTYDEHPKPTCEAGALIRFTIQVGAANILCESSSLKAIDLLLDWATRSQASQFKQLVVHDGGNARC